ncbi:MAG: hypothetical protein N2606_03415 [Candidatus Omnitrophica bacterium]|nr:hypothetical protein [Candidatus Omnitrophota bacterium]
MKKTILIMLVKTRRTSAVKVQRLLTSYGCMIKTRLGIHDGVLDKCSDVGLIILELVGEDDKVKELANKLKVVKGVKVKLVDISL